jgi:hypothetical protein
MMIAVPKIKKETVKNILKFFPEPHYVDINMYNKPTEQKIDGVLFDLYEKSARMKNPTKINLLQFIDDNSKEYKDKHIQLNEAFFYLDKLKTRKSKTNKDWTEVYGGCEISITLTEYRIKIKCRNSALEIRNKAAQFLLRLAKFEDVPVELEF